MSGCCFHSRIQSHIDLLMYWMVEYVQELLLKVSMINHCCMGCVSISGTIGLNEVKRKNRIARNIGGRKILADLAVWKITPTFSPPNFCFTYQARVSSSIVCSCRCFVTLKKMAAFLLHRYMGPLYSPTAASQIVWYAWYPLTTLSRTNFATSTSRSILTRVIKEWVWLVYNRKSAKFKPANMPNFAFPPTFSPVNISPYTVGKSVSPWRTQACIEFEVTLSYLANIIL